jgi:hypothetical protein
MACMASGTMNVVWLWYPRVFWSEGYNFLGVTCSAAEVASFSTFLIPCLYDDRGQRQPILMGQVFGEYARRIETQTPRQVAHEATHVLRRMLGADWVPDAIGCDHSRWTSDELARGAWSYVDVSSNEPHGLSATESVNDDGTSPSTTPARDSAPTTQPMVRTSPANARRKR